MTEILNLVVTSRFGLNLIYRVAVSRERAIRSSGCRVPQKSPMSCVAVDELVDFFELPFLYLVSRGQ